MKACQPAKPRMQLRMGRVVLCQGLQYPQLPGAQGNMLRLPISAHALQKPTLEEGRACVLE